MMDNDFKRIILNKLYDIKDEAAYKGHIIVLILLFIIFFQSCSILVRVNTIDDKLDALSKIECVEKGDLK